MSNKRIFVLSTFLILTLTTILLIGCAKKAVLGE